MSSVPSSSASLEQAAQGQGQGRLGCRGRQQAAAAPFLLVVLPSGGQAVFLTPVSLGPILPLNREGLGSVVRVAQGRSAGRRVWGRRNSPKTGSSTDKSRLIWEMNSRHWPGCLPGPLQGSHEKMDVKRGCWGPTRGSPFPSSWHSSPAPSSRGNPQPGTGRYGFWS